MNRYKIKLWLTLFALGLIGVASLLLTKIPLGNLPTEVLETVTPEQLRWIVLLNPALMVLLATLLGTLTYDRVKLSVPVIQSWLGSTQMNFSGRRIVKQGIVWGIVAGVLLLGINLLFQPYLPKEIADISETEDLNLFTRILYGGITEELLMRFGLMNTLCWILFKITRKLSDGVYWTAIAAAALLFAAGHLPVLYQMVEDPTFTTVLYVLLGNSVGGLIFGYTYWKNGLESAILAHMFGHLTMIAVSQLF